MILIELHHKDKKTQNSVWIDKTELTAPNVIFDKEQGRFFAKVPVDPRISTVGTTKFPLQYCECRGEVLSSIIVIRSPEEVTT